MTKQGPDLGDVVRERRSELKLDSHVLADILGWDADRIAKLEAHNYHPTFEELAELSLVLGLELESYDPELDAQPESRPEVTTLLKSQDNTLPRHEWMEIVGAAQVAHNIVMLEEWSGCPSRYEAIRERFQPLELSHEEPWRQGKALAERVRAELELGSHPIPSMYALCDELGIAIIETTLFGGVSALCLNDRHHGPSVVLNVQGHNESLLPRRYTLAHETCHILFDEYSMEGLKHFDREVGYFESKFKPDIEKRADAFGIHLLCPEPAFRGAWAKFESSTDSHDRCVRLLIERFGVSRTAILSHLKNLNLISYEQASAVSDVETDTPDTFREAEMNANYTAQEEFGPIPRERRRNLLIRAIESFEGQVIGRSKLIELLDIRGSVLDRKLDNWRQRIGEHAEKHGR